MDGMGSGTVHYKQRHLNIHRSCRSSRRGVRGKQHAHAILENERSVRPAIKSSARNFEALKPALCDESGCELREQKCGGAVRKQYAS